MPRYLFPPLIAAQLGTLELLRWPRSCQGRRGFS